MAMKSHDYHVILQQILPLCMWHKMGKVPRIAIMKICKIFKLICGKVYDLATYQYLKNGAMYSPCFLEKIFPPSFFYLITHLMVHLINVWTFVDLSTTVGCIALNVL
jgi:hypothetical protein